MLLWNCLVKLGDVKINVEYVKVSDFCLAATLTGTFLKN